MGGGGGGYGISSADLKTLEDKAKKALADGDTGTRNVFISFASEDLDAVNLLRGQAKNENLDLDFNDHSLKEPFDSENAEYIRRGIREKIRQSSVTVVYVSDSTAQSKWVDWEIRESLRQGKGVVAMYQGSSPPSKLPSAVAEFGLKPVKWAHKELQRAIENAAKTRKPQ